MVGVVGVQVFAASAAHAGSGLAGGQVEAGSLWCVNAEFLRLAKQDASGDTYATFAARKKCGKFAKTTAAAYRVDDYQDYGNTGTIYLVRPAGMGYVYIEIDDRAMDMDDGTQITTLAQQ
jgi:hypothetical protein